MLQRLRFGQVQTLHRTRPDHRRTDRINLWTFRSGPQLPANSHHPLRVCRCPLEREVFGPVIWFRNVMGRYAQIDLRERLADGNALPKTTVVQFSLR